MGKIIDVISSREDKENYLASVGISAGGDAYSKFNKLLVWKSQCEDFNTMTQLVVDESEEALFYLNGQALDLFGPGRHTLKTQNIPLLSRVLNLSTGGITPFRCKVYFINKTEQMAVKWGTDQHVEYMDPTYQFPLSLGASGEMSLRVEDSRKLVVKLIGTESVLTQEILTTMMRGILLTKFKSIFAHEIKTQGISIFDMDEHLDSLSQSVHTQLIEPFLDYGLALERFMIVRVAKPEGESTYEKFKQLHFSSFADVRNAEIAQKVALINQSTKNQQIIMESQALATKRAQEGYTFQEERSFDVAQTMAANEGMAELSNMGLGIGVAAGLGSAVAKNVTQTVEHGFQSVPIAPQESRQPENVCPKCGSPQTEHAKFCLQCGAKLTPERSVVCPQCGETVPLGKFCVECGASLQKTCPSCGKEYPSQARFCAECGTKL